MSAAIRKNAVPLLFLFLVQGVYFFPAIFLRHTFFFRDVMGFSIPEKWFQMEMYGQGALPLWNPHIFNGVPFLPLLHPNPAYPGNVLLWVGGFPYGFNLFLIAHCVLLVVSVYALVRHWGLGRGAATAASLVALLGGYFLSVVSLGNQLISTVWMPLILLSVQKFLIGESKGWLFTALFGLVMQILGGSPESCMLSTLLVLFASALITQARGTHWKQSLVVMSGLVVVALGLTAFQLIPTYFAVQHSVRAWDPDPDFHTQGSLEPDALLTLLFPHNFDTYMEGTVIEPMSYLPSIYMGILPACMVLLAPVLIKRREVYFWTAVFWLGIFLALGKYNSLYMAMLEINPFLKMFRYPEKFFFLSAFSMVFLTGYWWEAFIGKPVRTGVLPRALAFTIFTAVMLGGSLFAASGLKVGESFLWFAVFAGTTLLALAGKIQRHQTVKSLILLLLLMDLWNAHSRMIPFIDQQIYTRPPEVVQGLRKNSPPFRVFSGEYNGPYESSSLFPEAPNFLLSHIFQKDLARPNLGTIFGLDYADGVMAIEFEYVWLWTDMFMKSPPDRRRRMLERSNVHYQIRGTPDSPGVRRLDGALPRAFLVPRYRLGPEVKLLNTYFSKTFDPLQEVLLDKPVEFEASPDFAGEVEDITYPPNRVQVHTRQAGAGFLVLLDSWFPGWTVTVDGHPAPLLRANHFFRAVRLESGNHVVEFEYVPEGFVLGKTVSGITLFLVFAVAVAIRFRKTSGAGSKPDFKIKEASDETAPLSR